MNLVEIGTRVLTSCMDVKAGETVLVVTDDEKFQIGQTLYQAAKELVTTNTVSPRSSKSRGADRYHAQHHRGYVPSGCYDRRL